ncbi:conserved Plasmodium protein, unknown function [Plasmodium relictum]|uniref:Uncharacterized protein n=1 Tax=Plasmodium relictum TaxID=85471 RepID=A0A1J1HI77_PLARL|nr:conserved Plasmodium protein, unknown function [Plasmodium relictum]CRH03973.1 conserved Plasmodium protein, unknown function [Plasmodium relictum]
MSSKLFNINELNKDTILLKTKKLKKLCDNEGDINNNHINVLIEILEYFFEKYDGFFLSSIVWEVVDKIIILENIIEEKKKIDVDLDTSKRLCEFIFSKLIHYINYENENMTYLFSFNCLRRHLCSLISSFLNFNNSRFRRKIEASFTKELIDLIKKIFEKIKVENDLELKVSYTEFLWRSFRRVDLSSFNMKSFPINKETIEKLRNFKILKFDEECIEWLKEENYMDNKCIIERGSFIITANKSCVTKDFIFCYVGKCSIFLYYDNEEENEKCKIEIPYYHVTSAYFKNKTLLIMECKSLVDQTNIFCLWGDDIKNFIDYEIINKFTLSLEIKKGSKEVKKELNNLLDKINKKVKSEENKNEKNVSHISNHNREYKNEDKNKITNTDKKNIKEQFDDPLLFSNEPFMDKEISFSKEDKGNDKLINSFSDKLLKNNTRKRIETLKYEEKKKKYMANEDILGYEESLEIKNYLKGYENKNDFKKELENNSLLIDHKLDLSTPHTKLGIHNEIDRDSDTEIIIEKIISCHKEKKEKFKMNLKKSFSDAFNEIDNKIKLLVEKQKIRREELNKKYEKKKKNIILTTEKELNVLAKEMNILMESIKKINVNKNDIKKLYEEGKSIFSTSEILNKSQILVKKIKDNLEKMNTDIMEKEKEYNKRKKLCFKALATAYE